MGERLDEEKPIYARCIMKDGVKVWLDEYDPDDNGYWEDQLMGDFAFGVAARLLGERIDRMDDYFLDELPFKKCKKKTTREEPNGFSLVC